MNVNVTKIQRLSNGIIQFYNGTDIIDSFSITSSVSVLFENNLAKSISFISNVKTLSFNVYNVQSVYGATSNKIYSSGIDPSDTGSAYISRLYDIYAFIISDVIQGCCPGPTFVGGVVATYPDYASFPATGQESVIYIDESTGVAYFWNGTSYQELISLSASDKMVTIGRNSTGSTLYQGTVIYISGSTGNRPNYVKAQANSEATSAGTFGVILADISNNSDGYAVTIGTIDNLDTRSIAPNPFTSDTLADGDTIYLSPTTAGYVTNVKPYAPDHLVYVGKVVRTSPTNGVIVYRIQNGYELDEIHDVAAQTPSNNDGLFFESSTSLWKNKSISTILGYTPVPSTRTLTINGTSYDLSANRSWTIASNPGTVTSVAALTLGTTGTDLSSTVANSTSTPVITLNVPTASATNRGVLSSADWSTFNGKFTLPSLTSGSVLFSNGTTIAQNNANFFWDNTNSRLGVGSNAPVARLSVVDSANTVASLTANAASHFNISRGTSGVTNLVFTISSVSPNTAAIQHRHSNIDGIGYPIAINPLGGNVQIGTTTDAGFKLDVNGTARFVSDIRSTTGVYIGTTATFAGVFPSGTAGRETMNVRGGLFPSDIGIDVIISNAQGDVANTTSNRTLLGLSRGFNPTSGSGIYNVIQINPTINQTGGASGASRGLYINPTLTSAFDFRAIEVANGRVVIADTATVTGSNATSLLDLSQTWNTTGTPIAFKLNITDTASAALSDLMQLQVGGSTRFRVLKSGFFTFNTGGEIAGNLVVGGSTIDASSQLEVRSVTRGFLPPRMTTTQKNAIASPTAGLIVYDTTLGKLCVRGASSWETITSI